MTSFRSRGSVLKICRRLNARSCLVSAAARLADRCRHHLGGEAAVLELSEVVDDDRGALLGQEAGMGLADAPARAGDEGYLVGQESHGVGSLQVVIRRAVAKT